MDNSAAIQVHNSTYYLCDELLCYFYQVLFLIINFTNISTYAGSKHFGNDTLMHAIWSFNLEVIQKLVMEQIKISK